ncbi:hypothetical protein OL229_01235 [Neisseriaceae bacterium JH1-16]|nr:hypothetical protein [Neisseriaceae bacterium JH1-16]
MSSLADQLEALFAEDKVSCLTVPFAASLSGQDAAACTAALTELVERGVLTRHDSKSSSPDGTMSVQTTYFLRED